jgi:hypothetical protein
MSRGWYAEDPFSEYVDLMAVMSTASMMSFTILAVWFSGTKLSNLKVTKTAAVGHIF